MQFTGKEVMSNQKEVLYIYLVSVIHWTGYFSVLGVLHYFDVVPGLLLVGLGVLGFLLLPPIFEIVKKDMPDE